MSDFVAPGFKRGEEYTLPTGLTDHGGEIVITGVTSGRIVVESVEDPREKCRRGEHAAPKEHHVVTFPNGTTWACCPVCGCALINGRPDGPKV